MALNGVDVIVLAGIGILMVTHDTAVAECAQRIVKMEQGILVSQSV